VTNTNAQTNPVRKPRIRDDDISSIRNVISQENFRLLLQYIESTSYGSITLQIQDGKAVQIEKNEKIKIR
jgi:hypothetical protein